MLRMISNPIAMIAVVGIAASALSVSYMSGRNAGKGAALKQALKLTIKPGDNYIRLAANDKAACWVQIGQERTAHEYQLTFMEEQIEASDAARRSNAAQRQKYIQEARTARAEADRFLEQLEAKRNEFAKQRAPNDWVCAIYDGVFNIDGCRNGEFTGGSANRPDSNDDVRPEGASTKESG